MNKTIIGLLLLMTAVFVIACAPTEEVPGSQEDNISQEIPELSEVDQLLAELDALDEQLALDSDLEEMDLKLE